MAKGENKVQSKPEQFAKAYQELCDKYGYRISVNPAYMARDDGSWSLVLQTSVSKLPKQKLTKGV